MLSKLMSGIAGFAFTMAIGMAVTLQHADAAPWCYKTGNNTVQCVGR